METRGIAEPTCLNPHDPEPHWSGCCSALPPLVDAGSNPTRDRGPGGGHQWDIGTTSILTHAVGLAPSKDNYWSTQDQPGNPYGPWGDEPHSRLQSAVLSFSTGPVAVKHTHSYATATGPSTHDTTPTTPLPRNELMAEPLDTVTKHVLCTCMGPTI